MTNTILIKRSFTAGTEPASLAPGELAVNVTDKKVWIGDAAGQPVLINDKGEFASYLPLAGGEMTGSIVGPVDTDTLTWASGPFNAAVSSDGTKVVLSVNDGDATFTLQVDKIVASRPIELPLYAIEDNHAARVDYVNQRIAALGIPTPQTDKLGGVYAAEAEPGFTQYGISTSGAPIFKEIAVPPAKGNKLGGVYANVPTVNPENEFVRGVQEDGQLLFGNVTFPPATPYTLPTASATVLGGIKVGANLSIDANGVLSAAGGTTGAYLPLAGGTMTGAINVPATMDFISTPNGYSLYDNATGLLIRKGGTSIIAFGSAAITATVPVKLPADPTDALHAATKQYVDSFTSTAYVRKSGDVMSGPLRFSPSAYSGGQNGTDAYLYMDTAYIRLIAPSGKQVFVASPETGVAQFLGGAPQTAFSPTVDNDLANKKYVDGRLPLAGGTMTGTITMPTSIAGFQYGTTGYNVFGGSGGVAVRSNTTNIVIFAGANITNLVPMVTPATGVGVQFGSGGVTLSRGSAATKIASSGMIELPTTAPAAGEAVRKDYVDGRVIATAAGASAPATTGLSPGTLWVEY
jgi:hypothetical protein